MALGLRSALATVTTALIVIVTRALSTPRGRLLNGMPVLRDRGLTRLVVVALVFAIVLIAVSWRARGWRRLGLVALSVLTILGFAIIARGAAPTFPIADGALIELYTIHASHGGQTLGPYSQFGWHHPGPMVFYLSVPIYVLGGHSMAAVNAASVAINLAAIVAMAWVLARRRNRSGALAWIVPALVLLYMFRLPGVLVSAWNPHVALLALGALLVLTAAALSGDFYALPFVAAFASFVAQTHVAFVPLVGALLVLTAIGGFVLTVGRPDERRSFLRWGRWSVRVLGVLWLLPIAEQLSAPTGNLTLIGRFFLAAGPGQSFAEAWRAWSSSLAAAFMPGLKLPGGWGVELPGAVWPYLVGTLAAVAAIPVAVWAWLRQDRFSCALASVCAVASLVGLWSVVRIPGQIGDYQVHWLAIVGLLNVSLVLAPLLTPASDVFLDARVASVAAAALIIGAVALGTSTLLEARARPERGWENLAIESITQQILSDTRDTGTRHRPLIRFGAGMWAVGAGLMVQMARASVPVTVDAGMAWLFGTRFLTDGHEDEVWVLCGAAEHEVLSQRPHNLTLARDDEAGVFLDSLRAGWVSE